MKKIYCILTFILLVMSASDMSAQVDRKDVRRGNRDFKKENFREAEIDYRKALVKDSLSLAANYNLANTLYRQGDYAQAQQFLDKMKEVAPESSSAADYYFNLGDAALQQKDYQKAVEAFRQSLVIRPEDLQAKENFIYAKKMLQNQQNQQNQNNDQNQDNQNQNQDNQDQNQDNQNNQDQNDDQNKDQNDDQNKNDQNDDQKQDKNQDKKEQPQGQQPKISPQAAQQMLQAIQAKEKETQDKVNKQKAEALKSRQKEKNW